MSERCQFREGCPNTARYLIDYEDDVCGTCAACNDCTADARVNDPLGYIESVRSMPRCGPATGEQT